MLKKCSKRKGIKGFLQRKDLLTKIKQCDVELSNVLQAFQVRALFCHSCQLCYISPLQAELLLDVRVSLIVVNPEVRGTVMLN